MPSPPSHERGLYIRLNRQGQRRWYVRLMVQGRYRRFAPHGGFPSHTEARAFLANARTDIRRHTFLPEQFTARPLSLAELLEQQKAEQPDRPNRKNTSAYRAWWIARYGPQNVRTLSASLLSQARVRLAREAKAPQTQQHYLKFLRQALNQAIRDGLLTQSPFQTVALPAVHNMRVRFLSGVERRKLLRALTSPWREAAEIAMLTGLRWTEQFHLVRAHVHVTERYLELPTTKAGRPQVRLLNTRAAALLRQQLRRAAPSPWLYPSQEGARPVDYANFRKRIWLPACKAAKLVNVHWHDLRHTFASDLTMAGHSDRTVAHLLGHTSTQMVTRYAHLAPGHLRDAIQGLLAKSWPTTRRRLKAKTRLTR